MDIRTHMEYLLMSVVLLSGLAIIECGIRIETVDVLKIVVLLFGFVIVIMVIFTYILYIKLSVLKYISTELILKQYKEK